MKNETKTDDCAHENKSTRYLNEVNKSPPPAVENASIATENALPPAGENARGGVGVSVAASSTRVAIYSAGAPEKKSTASGGMENIGGALTPFGVEKVIQRLWEYDPAVPREHAMASAAARLHDAARCFAFTGQLHTAQSLCNLADFALQRAHEEKIARMNAEAKA